MHQEGPATHFIGREKEIQLFHTWFTAPATENPWILYLHDAQEAKEKKGGVGKTWLLRKYAEIAKKLQSDIVIVNIDFFNVPERDGAVIADRVVDALKEAYPYWKAPQFSAQLIEYRNAVREGKEDQAEVRTTLADALVADLRLLEEQLNEERKYLIIFFDTFELIEHNPLIAVLRLSHSFPDNYQFPHIGVVIAGRNALNWSQMNWKGREYEVRSIAISPFSEQEMQEYFRLLSNTSLSSAQVNALYQRTEGRPILVGLVNDVLNNQILSPEELINISTTSFEESLVSQINNLQRPIDSIVLFMAHAYHRFHFALLDWILREGHLDNFLQELSPQLLEKLLLNLSFIRRSHSGTDFVLHDEMRPLVNRYCWVSQDPDQRVRKLISKCVIDYYESELKTVQREQLRQAYIVEMLYHKLYLDLNDGYKFFLSHFNDAFNLWLNAFARSLLREISQFSASLSPEQNYTLKYFEGRLLKKEENAAMALVLYEELEREASESWLTQRRSRILNEKGQSYLHLSNFPQAISCFTAAQEIETDPRWSTSLLDWLGFAYQRQGQLDTALTYYKKALAIYQQQNSERGYAIGQSNIGAILRLQGKIEEALRRYKIALRIRKDLFKKGKLSEVYVGFSLNSIGAVYLDTDDLVQAEKSFQEARDIFIRIGYKKGLGLNYNRMGQVELARNNLPMAREWHLRAYTTTLGIDSQEQITSLRRQGQIAALQQQYDRATTLLQQALQLARAVHDEYQQAESLIEFANVLEQTKQNQNAQHAYQEAASICLKYEYHYLHGLAHEYQGNNAYHIQNYSSAFQKYGLSCYYMVHHNALQYKRLLRKITDALLDAPYSEINPAIDKLVFYWREQQLDQAHPDFISSCEEVRMLMQV